MEMITDKIRPRVRVKSGSNYFCLTALIGALSLFGAVDLSAQITLTIERAVLLKAELNPLRSYQLEGSVDGVVWSTIGRPVSGHSGIFSWCHSTESDVFQLFRVLEGEPLQDQRIIPNLGLCLVQIPAGRFSMGSPAGEAGRDSAEGPLREVEISESFWMGKLEVTQAEWMALMGDNPSDVIGETLPVNTVSWNDAVEFCEKLTQRERERERDAGRLEDGFVYRLPSEAEWEYACRAGTSTRYHWGEDLDLSRLADFAWTAENSNGQSQSV